MSYVCLVFVNQYYLSLSTDPYVDFIRGDIGNWKFPTDAFTALVVSKSVHPSFLNFFLCLKTVKGLVGAVSGPF